MQNTGVLKCAALFVMALLIFMAPGCDLEDQVAPQRFGCAAEKPALFYPLSSCSFTPGGFSACRSGDLADHFVKSCGDDLSERSSSGASGGDRCDHL